MINIIFEAETIIFNFLQPKIYYHHSRCQIKKKLFFYITVLDVARNCINPVNLTLPTTNKVRVNILPLKLKQKYFKNLNFKMYIHCVV